MKKICHNKQKNKMSSKEKNLLLIISSLFFILSLNFVSSESLSEILSSIEPSLVFLTTMFIIIFALVYFSLNKYFKKENQTISGIISLAVSLLAVYSINKAQFITNFDFGNIGLSESNAGWLFFLISAAVLVFLIKKFKIDSLWIIGILVMGVSLFTYENDALFILGAFLIISRLFFKKKKKDD